MNLKKPITFLLFFFICFANSQVAFIDNATSKGVGVSFGDSNQGGGVSFVDFNGDGWDDLTLSSEENEEIFFFQNVTGLFVSVDLGISDTGAAKQVLWVDYDNDGDKDFFVNNLIGLNKLYRNDNGTFTDVSSACGINQQDHPSYGAAFGDIDNDGDLDLFISNKDNLQTQRNYLYRNNNGQFEDISIIAGINSLSEFSFCASFFDFDNDGDQDIYIANDRITNPNRLYRNEGDLTFTDVSVSSGAGVMMDAMSTTIGDYNSDGWFDIYVTNTPAGNALLKNNGDGTFTNVAVATGTDFLSIGWGAVFLDADNDTNLDLYVSGLLNGSDTLPSAFYYNNGDDTFTIPANAGFDDDTRQSYANAIGDINNDGKADIIVMNEQSNYFLWENQTTTSNNWIKIKLEGVVSNKDGIGNKIEVFANGESQYRYTVCGEGYLGQNSQYEFVGLASATTIDYIKVTWNMTGQVETINNIQPNQAITIKEGSGILNVEDFTANLFTVYPNPSDGLFFFSKELPTTSTIEVFDLTGKKLEDPAIQNNYIDLSRFLTGIYFLRVTSENRVTIQKIIKN